MSEGALRGSLEAILMVAAEPVAAEEVAAALGINMHTVLRAYQLLRDEGLIELRKGRGAVVLATTPGFSRLSDLITQTLAESNRLGIPLDDLVHMFRERTASR